MTNYLWRGAGEDLTESEKATYAAAVRPNCPVVLVVYVHGDEGYGFQMESAFPTVRDAMEHANREYDRSGHLVDPLWISNGEGKWQPTDH